MISYLFRSNLCVMQEFLNQCEQECLTVLSDFRMHEGVLIPPDGFLVEQFKSYKSELMDEWKEAIQNYK